LEKSLIAELKDRADRAFKEVVFPQKRQQPRWVLRVFARIGRSKTSRISGTR
jgi:hypothetical protein